MLYGVMVVYNDWPLIKTAVESIYDKVDSIVAVDGKYIDFPGKEHFSTDGTVEYLMELEKVNVIFCSEVMEPDKRNKYLVGANGDWYLHLDADEEWVGGVHWGHDMMITPLKDSTTKQVMNRIRLFRHIEGLHYHHKHYWLTDSKGNRFATLDRPGDGYKAGKFNDIKIIHHDYDRLPDRISKKRQYYRILTKREGRYRE